MKKKLFACILSAMIAAITCGCGSKTAPTLSVESEKESSSEIENVSRTEEETETPDALEYGEAFSNKTVKRGLDSFTSEMFKNCYTGAKGQNTLVSPLSVYTALSMTANGAVGDTESELLDVLSGYIKSPLAEIDYADHAPASMQDINSSLSSYINGVNSGEILSIANAMFVMDRGSGSTVNEQFEKTIVDHYNAEMFCEPYTSSTVDHINAWVKDKTYEMIPQILAPNSINESTQSVLLNAAAFEGKWWEEYTEDDVWEQDFNNYSGSVVQTEFLHGEESSYFESENAAGFLKYYKAEDNDHNFAFTAILPNEDTSIDDYIASVNGDTIDTLIKSAETCTVQAFIPKFKFDCDFKLKQTLSDMGLEKAFEADADFSGIVKEGLDSPHIGEVIHKTHVELDEKGTKAAAATAIIMEDNCVAMDEPEIKVVTLDRPFVFVIYDMTDSVPVFVGAVCEM